MSGPGTPSKGVLFVSYDGVLGGPGRSQVLPYLRGYRAAGWSAHLLSYEKPPLLAEEGTRSAVEEELRAAGIRWTVLPYRRSMLRDLRAGLAAVERIVEAERPAVLHARSYVPAFLCRRAGRRRGARLLFDMRGLWPDERVDGGLWSRWNPLHLLWKRIERSLLRDADGVVLLSRAGERLLRDEGLLPAGTPSAVIPCGADLERFRPGATAGTGAGDGAGPGPGPGVEAPEGLRPFLGKRIFTFLGATGTWYLLPEMLDFAAAAVAADADARILFLTEDPGGAVGEGLAARGVPADRVLVRRVPHAEVPRWIAPSAAGVFFIRSCRSKKASCPTKLAEFLACGVPVVVNAGIGDMDEIVGGTAGPGTAGASGPTGAPGTSGAPDASSPTGMPGSTGATGAKGGSVGVVVKGFDGAALRGALSSLAALRTDPGLAARCRRTAEETLDAAAGGRAFAELAERIRARGQGALP